MANRRTSSANQSPECSLGLALLLLASWPAFNCAQLLLEPQLGSEQSAFQTPPPPVYQLQEASEPQLAFSGEPAEAQQVFASDQSNGISNNQSQELHRQAMRDAGPPTSGGAEREVGPLDELLLEASSKTSQFNETHKASASAGGSLLNSASSLASGSSSSGSLGEQLSSVGNLLQQAGQLGLSVVQQQNEQNAALSEAIVNGLASVLAQQQQQQRTKQAAATSTSRPPLVNQNSNQNSINGNIEYDSNQNSINGHLELPNVRPNLGGAVKPLLTAALKAAPVKLGSAGWKLIKLLAWKKIYKTHHPKSGEIIIEQQELASKPAQPHQLQPAELKAAKLGMLKQLKTTKMGLSGAGLSSFELGNQNNNQNNNNMDEWLGSGHSSAPFDALAAASVLHQRNLLAPIADMDLRFEARPDPGDPRARRGDRCLGGR